MIIQEEKCHVGFGNFRKLVLLLIGNTVEIIRSIFRKSMFMFRKEELNNITVCSVSSICIFDRFAQ